MLHIKKHRENHERNYKELNIPLDLLPKYKNNASVFKDIFNEKNMIDEKHNRNLIESQQNMGRDT